jgi:hypothetical protein
MKVKPIHLNSALQVLPQAKKLMARLTFDEAKH